MGSLDRNIPKFSIGHLHRWVSIDRNIVAEKQKGEREKIYVEGDYQECPKCHKGRLVPRNERLVTVECEKIEAPTEN